MRSFVTGILLSWMLAANAVQAQEKPSKQGISKEVVEKLLTEILQPGIRWIISDPQRVQQDYPGVRFLEKPELPLSRFQGLPPRPGLEPSGAPVQPRHLKEGSPLAGNREQPVLPGNPRLPEGQLVKVAGVDVHQPLSLPILAQPHRDRASLADPSLEASVSAALMAKIPLRNQPAAFVPLNLPEPFENAQAVRLQQVPAEEETPPLYWPKQPGK